MLKKLIIASLSAKLKREMQRIIVLIAYRWWFYSYCQTQKRNATVEPVVMKPPRLSVLPAKLKREMQLPSQIVLTHLSTPGAFAAKLKREMQLVKT